MLVEWNQPPEWTSFSASIQPAVQVQLLDVHLMLHKATESNRIISKTTIVSYYNDLCKQFRYTVHTKLETNLSISDVKVNIPI